MWVIALTAARRDHSPVPSTRGHNRSLERALRALSARCADPDPPSSAEVEDALERGFARLIVLEATLQRLTTTPEASESTPDGGHSSSLEELMEEIGSLHDALEDLRGRTTEWPAAPLALGFVFPTGR